MDFTTLGLVVMLTIGALGFDTFWHPRDVILEGSTAGKLEKATVDQSIVNLILKSEVDKISATPSLMAKPQIRTEGRDSVALALAKTVNMESVAYALQAQVASSPDTIRVALFSEDGIAKVLVTGTGRPQVGRFEQVVEQQKGETVVALLHRAALVGMSRIDPYMTALNLLQRHQADKDFADLETLITFAKSQIPPVPTSFDRSLLENLQGIMALFRGSTADAHTWFELAVRSSPNNTAAILNDAFAELQLGEFRRVAERMQVLLDRDPPADRVLLSTAYVTWGSACLGLHEVERANALLAKAVAANPDSATAWELLSAAKREKGDEAEADRLHRKALEVSGNFENYAEIAALYFQLAWHDHQPVTRSMFMNFPGQSR